MHTNTHKYTEKKTLLRVKSFRSSHGQFPPPLQDPRTDQDHGVPGAFGTTLPQFGCEPVTFLKFSGLGVKRFDGDVSGMRRTHPKMPPPTCPFEAAVRSATGWGALAAATVLTTDESQPAPGHALPPPPALKGMWNSNTYAHLPHHPFFSSHPSP